MWLNFMQNMSTGETSVVDEPSLLEELWDYIVGTYFTVNTGRYEYINVGTSTLVNLQTIIIGLFIGVIIAGGIACYDKNRLGSFVRAIVKKQCLWPEKAMTLEELGFARSGGIRRSLRSRNQLGRIVRCVERDRYDAEVEAARAAYAEKHGNDNDFFMPPYRIDFDNDHFYIPDEEHYRAEVRYENKGSGWRAFLLVVIVSIFSMVMLCFLMPDMLQLVDNLIGILSENDKYLK